MTTPLEDLSDTLDLITARLENYSPPPGGWINKIRSSANIPLTHLAEKLKVNPEAVKKYEQSEAARKISLETLDKIADALDMRLVYYLVPREKKFFDKVRERVLRYVRRQLRADHKTPAAKIEKRVAKYLRDIPIGVWGNLEEQKIQLKKPKPKKVFTDEVPVYGDKDAMDEELKQQLSDAIEEWQGRTVIDEYKAYFAVEDVFWGEDTIEARLRPTKHTGGAFIISLYELDLMYA